MAVETINLDVCDAQTIPLRKYVTPSSGFDPKFFRPRLIALSLVFTPSPMGDLQYAEFGVGRAWC